MKPPCTGGQTAEENLETSLQYTTP